MDQPVQEGPPLMHLSLTSTSLILLKSVGALLSRCVPARWCSSCGGHDMGTASARGAVSDKHARTCLPVVQASHTTLRLCWRFLDAKKSALSHAPRKNQNSKYRCKILLARTLPARRQNVSLQLSPHERFPSPDLPISHQRIDSTGMLGILNLQP